MTYAEQLNDFKTNIFYYVDQIFRVYAYELKLSLEDYNLLIHPHNCLESSTSLGYLIEEFVVSKLEMYTSVPGTKYQITRTPNPTNTSSYDCISSLADGTRILINVKIEKEGSSNNAVAAIRQIVADYNVDENPKSLMILKIHYRIGCSKFSSERKILYSDVDGYFIDEVDFSSEHRQDKRSWSGGFDPQAGRLQVSEKFRREHKVDKDRISYENTKTMINRLKDLH